MCIRDRNDRDLLRATAVTRGWNEYRKKSQHRKMTMEKKLLPPLLQGFEPATFQSRVRRSNHGAIPSPRCIKQSQHGSNKPTGRWRERSRRRMVLAVTHTHTHTHARTHARTHTHTHTLKKTLTVKRGLKMGDREREKTEQKMAMKQMKAESP